MRSAWRATPAAAAGCLGKRTLFCSRFNPSESPRGYVLRPSELQTLQLAGTRRDSRIAAFPGFFPELFPDIFPEVPFG